jgi:hypothetical protein
MVDTLMARLSLSRQCLQRPSTSLRAGSGTSSPEAGFRLKLE